MAAPRIQSKRLQEVKGDVQVIQDFLADMLSRHNIRCTRNETISSLMTRFLAYTEVVGDEDQDPDQCEEVVALLKRSLATRATVSDSLKLVLCAICLEYSHKGDFPAHNITNECQHSDMVCKACIKQHIAAGVSRFLDPIDETRSLQCPICNEELDGAHIREFGDPENSSR